MVNTFDWVEIRTSDLESCAAFYLALFGWKIIERQTVEGSGVMIFDTNSEPRVQNLRRGGIWARPAGEAPGVIVYIVVGNIDATLKKVKDLGGQVISGKIDLGSGMMAVFADPWGVQFGLYEDKPLTSGQTPSQS